MRLLTVVLGPFLFKFACSRLGADLGTDDFDGGTVTVLPPFPKPRDPVYMGSNTGQPSWKSSATHADNEPMRLRPMAEYLTIARRAVGDTAFRPLAAMRPCCRGREPIFAFVWSERDAPMTTLMALDNDNIQEWDPIALFSYHTCFNCNHIRNLFVVVRDYRRTSL